MQAARDRCFRFGAAVPRFRLLSCLGAGCLRATVAALRSAVRSTRTRLSCLSFPPSFGLRDWERRAVLSDSWYAGCD